MEVPGGRSRKSQLPSCRQPDSLNGKQSWSTHSAHTNIAEAYQVVACICTFKKQAVQICPSTIAHCMWYSSAFIVGKVSDN